jgi:hypothetical protein
MLMIGIANGAFGTLAPVFGANVGLETITIATMMSVTIFSGALMQIPRRPDVGPEWIAAMCWPALPQSPAHLGLAIVGRQTRRIGTSCSA